MDIDPEYSTLSNPVKMKKTWRGNLKQTYEEIVTTYGSLPEEPSSSGIQGVYQLPATESWREREGVEPTAPTEGPGPTDLKSEKPTGTHPLPLISLFKQALQSISKQAEQSLQFIENTVHGS